MVYAVWFDGEPDRSCKGLKAILSKFTSKAIDRFDARRLDLPKGIAWHHIDMMSAQ